MGIDGSGCKIFHCESLADMMVYFLLRRRNKRERDTDGFFTDSALRLRERRENVKEGGRCLLVHTSTCISSERMTTTSFGIFVQIRFRQPRVFSS